MNKEKLTSILVHVTSLLPSYCKAHVNESGIPKLSSHLTKNRPLLIKFSVACIFVFTISILGIVAVWTSAQESESQDLMRFLPRAREDIAKLSIRELGLTFADAEERLGTSSIQKSRPCKNPTPPRYYNAELELQRQAMNEIDSMDSKRIAITKQAAKLLSTILRYMAAIKTEDQNIRSFERGIDDAIEKEHVFVMKGRPAQVSILHDRFRTSIYRAEEALEKRKEESKKDAKQLQLEIGALTDQLRTLIPRILKLERDLNDKLSEKDNKGRTWLQRAIIYDHPEFVGLLKRLVQVGSQATLEDLLMAAVSVGDSRSARALLRMGARVYQPPGTYTPLALAKSFGENGIGHILKQEGAVIQVPWNPMQEETSREIVDSLENQLSRVAAFFQSAPLSPDDQDYTMQVLQYYRCKLDYLKSQGN